MPIISSLPFALGPTSLWPIATLCMASIWLFGLGKPNHGPNWRYAPPLCLIIGSVAISSTHSQFWAYGFLYCEVIAIAWLAGQGISFGTKSLVPIIAVVLINGMMAMAQTGYGRPDGINSNATQLGMAGVVSLPYGAVLVGLSESRTAVLGLIVYALFRLKWLVLICAVVGLSVFLLYGRERIASIGDSIAYRTEIIKGNVAGSDCFEAKETVIDGTGRNWKWQGYGFLNSCNQGLVTPHNIYVDSFYELGILVIPFWIGVLWLWWLKGRNYAILAVVGVTGLFMQDWYARIEGIYGIMCFYVIDEKLGGKTQWASYRLLLASFFKSQGRIGSMLKSNTLTVLRKAIWYG